jgi:hypothetical protein
MNKTLAWPLSLAVALTLLAGCGGGSSGSAVAPNPASLSASNVNLIFVVSEDLAHHAQGDVSSSTANLTDRGLQRSLRMAGFLKRRVLGNNNVTGVYVLEPMTHLQAAGSDKYPDMAALETVQQFALLNQITLYYPPNEPTASATPITGNSFPINDTYFPGAQPSAIPTPDPACPQCQGLDFQDQGGDNEALATGIITANAAGYYVFSAPWETTSALLAAINRNQDYNSTLPAGYAGPDYIYAISIAPSGTAKLVTYNTRIVPASTYPKLPTPVPTPCGVQTLFIINVDETQSGVTIPTNINTNETVYLVRHAEAHPGTYFEDGNYVCAGQWRALDLPRALKGKISPNAVYSIDPAQTLQGDETSTGRSIWSYVRPALTVEPYAIANNLPFGLEADSLLGNCGPNEPGDPCPASSFFFTGGAFNNQTLLVGWEHDHIPLLVNYLVGLYYPNSAPPQNELAPTDDWPPDDYDTIWTVKLDDKGNLTVNNALCEGIDSNVLPATCPQF